MPDIGAEHLKMFAAVKVILDGAAKAPMTQQQVLELLMAWHASRAGDKSDVVLNAMARHAKQMVSLVRGQQ